MEDKCIQKQAIEKHKVFIFIVVGEHDSDNTILNNIKIANLTKQSHS